VAWLKADPQKANVATAGLGSASHVMGAYLQQIVGSPLGFVHYRGAGPALQDLVGGHIDLFINQPSILLPQLRDGKIKVFAVLDNHRLVQAPSIPTSVEAGLPEFQMTVWHGLWAPKGTPEAVIHTLNAAVKETLEDTLVRGRLIELGYNLPFAEQLSSVAL